MAVPRSATGGRVVDTPAAPWVHDLATTSTYTDLWPRPLILALLLWPLDIALRRVSIGRRELADAWRWVGGGWRRRGRTAPRPAEVAGMLAARDRATGPSARAAILPGDSPAPPGGAATAALVMAGCGALLETPPAATPTDFGGIAGDMVQRGITLDHIASGDAGCNDPILAQTAIRFDADGLDQTSPTRVYIYIFGDHDA